MPPPPPPDRVSILAAHRAQQQAHKDALALAKTRDRTLSNARLASALVAIGLVAAIAFHKLPEATWIGVFLLVAAFVLLVILHARLARRTQATEHALRFHEEALARAADRWRELPVPRAPDVLPAATHPYADDLDLFGSSSLWHKLGASTSRFGRARLAAWLAGEELPSFPEGTRLRQEAVRDLAARIELREVLFVQAALSEETDPNAFLAWVEKGPALDSAPIRAIAFVLPAVTLTLFVVREFGLVSTRVLAVPVVLTIALLFALAARTRAVLAPALGAASSMLAYGEALARIEKEAFAAPHLVAQKARLDGKKERVSALLLSLDRTVGLLEARQNEVFRLLIAPFLLWDVHAALTLSRWRSRARAQMLDALDVLAEIEALAVLSGDFVQDEDAAFPELTLEDSFTVEGLAHPLLPRTAAVGNDLTIPGPGSMLLVTGSNMSGKSTWLRAMGLAAVVARIGGAVRAKSCRTGELRVATSLRVKDAVDEGVSRFYAELLKLKTAVDLARAAKSPPLFFLFDEVLSGTNAREREIGARALVSALLREGAMGAISTHDLPLAKLAEEHEGHVLLAHFRENVKDGKMTFDYVLRPGVVQSSNALHLMKDLGLPIDI